MAKAAQRRKTTKKMDTTTSTKQTLEQRLAAAEKLVEKYKAQINAERQINNVQVGDDVTFKFGRAEKSRNMDGTVTAVADTDTGRMVAIQTGEGLDVEIKKVRAADIVENRTAATRGDDTPAAEEGSEEADPLNAA